MDGGGRIGFVVGGGCGGCVVIVVMVAIAVLAVIAALVVMMVVIALNSAVLRVYVLSAMVTVVVEDGGGDCTKFGIIRVLCGSDKNGCACRGGIV